MFHMCRVRFTRLIDRFDKAIKIFHGGIEGLSPRKVHWPSLHVPSNINGRHGGAINTARPAE